MIKRNLLSGLLSILIITGLGSVTVKAQSVNYQILKDGGNQTSYASAYFTNPADVTVQGDSYHVRLVVATSHELGRFPVKVAAVNGQKPQVSETTHGNMDYYTIAFNANNLTDVINGTMHVDVDALNYHHDYAFGLKFNQSNLPTITKPTADSSKTNPTTAINPPATASSTSTTTSSSSSASSATHSSSQSSSGDSLPVTSQSSSSQATNSTTTPVAKSSSGSATSASSVQGAVTAANSTKKEIVTVTPASNKAILGGSIWWYIGGGILTGGILISILSYLKRRANH